VIFSKRELMAIQSTISIFSSGMNAKFGTMTWIRGNAISPTSKI
jgi:hypothetical protein